VLSFHRKKKSPGFTEGEKKASSSLVVTINESSTFNKKRRLGSPSAEKSHLPENFKAPKLSRKGRGGQDLHRSRQPPIFRKRRLKTTTPPRTSLHGTSTRGEGGTDSKVVNHSISQTQKRGRRVDYAFGGRRYLCFLQGRKRRVQIANGDGFDRRRNRKFPTPTSPLQSLVGDTNASKKKKKTRKAPSQVGPRRIRITTNPGPKRRPYCRLRMPIRGGREYLHQKGRKSRP